jgi:hypothetical protein
MNATLHKCSCPHCSQNLEYEDAYAGQQIDCPSCNGSLKLPEIPFVEPKPGLVEGWFEKLRAVKESVEDKAALREMLMDAVSDGVLTNEEIRNIQSFIATTGLSEDVVQDWSVKLFRRAFESLEANDISGARLDSLDAIRNFLRVPPGKIEAELNKLARMRYVLGIREGKMPAFQAQNVMLRAGEIIHWIQPARLWESRVVGRSYQGGSSGVSFRIAKGITLRTGATRGRSISETEDQIVSEGNFLISNRRLIFQGNAKSFETKYEKILDIHNHLDGIRYSESNKQKPRQIQYTEPNGDVIVEILAKIFSAPIGV